MFFSCAQTVISPSDLFMLKYLYPFAGLILFLTVSFSQFAGAQGVLRAEKRVFLAPEEGGISPDFIPKGLVYKGFTYFPTLRIAQAYNSNVYAEADGGQDDFILRVSPSIKILKNYGGLNLSATGQIKAERYQRFTDEGKEDISLNLSGDYVLNSRWAIPFSIDYSSFTLRRGDPLSQKATSEPLTYTQKTAALGLSRRFNRLKLSLQGQVEETLYNDGTALLSGAPVIYRDNDRRGYSGRLGLRYDLGLGEGGDAEHILFANLDYKTSKYLRRDYSNGSFSGILRNNTEFGGFLGFETSHKNRLFANIGIGYFKNEYDDSRLTGLADIDFGAEIEYEFTPKWRLGGAFEREISQDNDIVQGEVETQMRLFTSYEIYSRLFVNGAYEFTEREYGQDRQTDNESEYKIGALYVLNRNWRMDMQASTIRFESGAPNESYDANVYTFSFVGKL